MTWLPLARYRVSTWTIVTLRCGHQRLLRSWVRAPVSFACPECADWEAVITTCYIYGRDTL